MTNSQSKCTCKRHKKAIEQLHEKAYDKAVLNTPVSNRKQTLADFGVKKVNSKNKQYGERILEVKNLKKYFSNKSNVLKAVDDVSFNVHEGEILGLIGESGSGKTTVGRTLLRYYENYNGFVTLDKKIISGKKISKDRLHYMRKSIQMIFQDPMASLNGQHTIFTILKEPLVVNGIIKDKVKDLTKDWDKVKENFHYTFLELSKKLELENYILSSNKFEPYLSKWEKEFNKIKFDKNNSLDDTFNSFFAFMEERNKINSEVINNVYSATSKLIETFEQKKKDFEEEKIDFDEIELKEAEEELKLQKVLNRKSVEYYDSKNAFKSQYKEAKALVKEAKDIRYISESIIDSLISEIKSERNLTKNNAQLSTDLSLYGHFYKLYLINQHVYKLLKKYKNDLRYISFEEGKELRSELLQYIKNFYTSELNFEFKIKEDVQKAKLIVKDSFNFDFEKFLLLSKVEQNNYAQLISSKYKESAINFKVMIQKYFKKPEDNEEAYENAKQRFANAKLLFDIELKKYVEKLQTRISLLDQEIAKEVERENKLREKEKELIKRFNELNKQYNKFVTQNYISPLKDKIKQLSKNKSKNKKEYSYLKRKIGALNVELKAQHTLVKDRTNAAKGFSVESKYLNKDLENIKLLLGIHNIDIFFKAHPKLKFMNALTKSYKIRRLNALYIKSTIYKALEEVGLLKQFAYRYPHEFSGGQRQRIVIARALITNPKVIVADEPIASLDISIQAQIVNLFKDLCKNKNIGIIFIAHDLSMIEYVADNVQIMHLGKIVENGKTERIYENPIHPYTNNLFEAIPKISNADKKFENITFETSYIAEQQYPNVAIKEEIENKHWVYGTKAQIKKWLKVKKGENNKKK